MGAHRQMKLGMFLRPAGHHVAGWRHRDAWADGGLNFATYVEMARTAERGLFDLLFSADALTGERYDRDTLSRTSYVAWIEPMSLLTALAPMTHAHRARLHRDHDLRRALSHRAPLRVARSHQRRALGLESGDLGERRARRRISAARSICPSTSATGARASSSTSCAACGIAGTTTPSFSTSRAAVSTTRTAAMCSITRASSSRCSGPLTVSRSPQGQPVVVQAGASDDGRQLAAETAEVVFCRASDHRGRARVLRRREGPDGPLRPRSRPSQDHAGARRHGRARPGRRRRTNTRSCRTSSIRKSVWRCCPNTSPGT